MSIAKQITLDGSWSMIISFDGVNFSAITVTSDNPPPIPPPSPPPSPPPNPPPSPPPSPIPIPPPSPPPSPTPIPPAPAPIPPPSPPPTPNVMGTIDVTNFSIETNRNIQTYIDAIKIQCDRDVAPIWGHTVKFNMVSSGSLPVKGNWQCGVFDDSDQAGVLGWHDVGPNNEPLIKIFVKEAAKFGENPSVTLSHEVLECIGDANANTTVKGQDPDGRVALLFQELCDAVESDTYDINGVKVSDFITPDWFNESPKSGEFDFLKVTSKPFQLASGGYEEVSYDNGNSWTQINKASQRMGMHAISHRKTIYHKKPEDRKKSTFKMQSA